MKVKKQLDKIFGKIRERYCLEQGTNTICDGDCSNCGIWEWIKEQREIKEKQKGYVI